MRTFLLAACCLAFGALTAQAQENADQLPPSSENIIIAKIKKDGKADQKIIEVYTSGAEETQRLVDSIMKVHGEGMVELNVIKLPEIYENMSFEWNGVEDMDDIEALERVFEMGEHMKWMDVEDFTDIADIEDLKWMQEDKPFLGVIIDTDEKIESGIRIMNIVEGSAAEAAGLTKEDILTGINNLKVNSLDDLVEALSQHEVGDEIEVKYKREGKSGSATATLKSRADSNYDLAKSFNFKKPECCSGDEPCEFHSNHVYKAFVQKQKPRLGVYVENLDDEMIEDLKIKAGKGVLVTKVLDETTAKKMGLKVNDVILSINDQEITDVNALHEALAAQKLGDEIEVKYVRYGEEKTADGVLFEFNHHSALDQKIFYRLDND